MGVEIHVVYYVSKGMYKQELWVELDTFNGKEVIFYFLLFFRCGSIIKIVSELYPGF